MCGLRPKHIKRTGTTGHKFASRRAGRIERMKAKERDWLEALWDGIGPYSPESGRSHPGQVALPQLSGHSGSQDRGRGQFFFLPKNCESSSVT